MNTDNDITQGYDDLIFENRNKTYGAYSIRREYDSNLSKGTFASFLFVACLFGVAYGAMMLRNDLDAAPIGPTCHLPSPPPTIIRDQQVKEVEPPRVKGNADLPPLVTDKPVADPPPAETQTTASNGNEDGPPVEIDPGIVVASGAAVPTIVAQPQTLDIAQVMPVFEGGTKALYKFLRKTLRYPRLAQQTGEEGTVYVRFVIDVTGSVTGIEVINGVTAALDKEASRVISLMPRWKPGLQHGAPVNVRMVLPIKFEFNKE